MSSSQEFAREIRESTGAERHYFEALDNGEFIIQRCQNCDKSIFFPRMLCPHCGSDDLQWFRPSGNGIVYSTTVVRRKPEHGGDYNVAVIDLDEGVRMMSRVEAVEPGDVRIGMRVAARILESADGNMVVFNPLEAAQ